MNSGGYLQGSHSWSGSNGNNGRSQFSRSNPNGSSLSGRSQVGQSYSPEIENMIESFRQFWNERMRDVSPSYPGLSRENTINLLRLVYLRHVLPSRDFHDGSMDNSHHDQTQQAFGGYGGGMSRMFGFSRFGSTGYGAGHHEEQFEDDDYDDQDHLPEDIQAMQQWLDGADPEMIRRSFSQMSTMYGGDSRAFDRGNCFGGRHC